jgi:hypothetical protein
MHDHFHEHYEWDADGQLKKKKRVLPDGARMSVAMGFYDHFSDGSPDYTNPHAPGFRFSDTDDPARVAAQQAYDERNKRMATAWMRKGEPPQQVDARDRAPRTLDELQHDAISAWESRNRRLDYRNRRHAR